MRWILAIFCFAFISGCSGSPEPASTTVDTAAVKAILPVVAEANQPVVIDFNSRFCMACQQLKGKLATLQKDYPDLTVKSIDIQHPTPDEARVIKAFNVLTVPMVVFVTSDGEVKKVILDDVPYTELKAAASTLQSPKEKPHGAG